MAGYHGYSMSNNAVLAYEYGEKPYSKWTKSDIIEEIQEYYNEYDFNFSIENLKKLNTKEIKNELLRYSSWHHTSSMYNRTEFYSVSLDILENLSDIKIDEIISKRKPDTKTGYKYGYAKVQVWGGTRNHRKIIGHEEIFGIVVGDWLHYMDYYKIRKIKVDGNNVVNYSSYDDIKSLFKNNKTDRKEKIKKDIKNIIKEKELKK